MATLLKTPHPDFTQRSGETLDAWLERSQARLNELQRHSDTLPTGELVGGLLGFPVADGKAFYLVTKARPLTLQHVPFLDGYALPAAHLRGLRCDEVESHLEHNRRLAQLFARNR